MKTTPLLAAATLLASLSCLCSAQAQNFFSQTLTPGVTLYGSQPQLGSNRLVLTFSPARSPLDAGTLTLTATGDINGPPDNNEYVLVYGENGSLLGTLFDGFDNTSSPITDTGSLSIPLSLLSTFAADRSVQITITAGSGVSGVTIDSATLTYPSPVDELPISIGHVLYSAGSFSPVLRPPPNYEGGLGFLVLMPDETTPLITFDGSRSFDPDGKPLLYRWMTLESEQMEPLPGTTWSASPYVTIRWFPNTTKYFYLAVLEADKDPALNGGWLSEPVRVGLMSPGAVMSAISESIAERYENPNSSIRRSLRSTADLAAQQFRAGKHESAIATVQLFQRQVRTLLLTSRPIYAETLIRLSQAVIDHVRMKYPAPQ